MIKKLFLSLILLIIYFLLLAQVYSSPVPPDNWKIKYQPDGTPLRLLYTGDEFEAHFETEDGFTVVKNKDNFWCYAKKNADGKLEPTDKIAGKDYPPYNLVPHLKNKRKKIKRFFGNQFQSMAIPTIDSFFRRSDAPVTEIKVAVILIEFQDISHSAGNETSFFNSFLYDLNTDTSFRNYYRLNSSGLLNIDMQLPTTWYKVSNTLYHYTVAENDTGISNLVQEAIHLADAEIDYSQYNNLIIVHSGDANQNTGDSSDISTHKSVITMETAEGMIGFNYILVAEPAVYRADGDGVGTYCHEFGHILGLPDLYDVDGGSEGIGEWGLMGSGNHLTFGSGGRDNNPANMCAWSKYYLGWLDFKEIRDTRNNEQHLIINASETPALSPRAFLVPVNSLEADFNRQEYFLIEYRENDPAISIFDRGLPGRGLLIWHIDDGKLRDNYYYNTVNSDENRKGVDLEEADGNNDLDKQTNSGDATDPFFPGIKDEFGYNTNPSSFSNDGYNTRFRVSNIAFGPGFAQMQFDLYASIVSTQEDVLNYPNPFRLGIDEYTTIELTIGTIFLTHKYKNGEPVTNDYSGGTFQVDIFDRAGRPVRHLAGPPFIDDFNNDGIIEARWDGLNDRGRMVEPGIYFYAVKYDGGRKMNRMTVIKW